MRRYVSKRNQKVPVFHVDKFAQDQSFIELDCDEKFMVMLSMYEDEKEVTLYATTDNWEKYVDSCYSIEKFKEAYAFEIALMPRAEQWKETNGDKIYPPIIKRPAGRPKTNRIKASNESKRRHKCPRCGEYRHREKTCKNPEPQGLDPSETSISNKKNKCPR